jgi:hypothetical protein
LNGKLHADECHVTLHLVALEIVIYQYGNSRCIHARGMHWYISMFCSPDLTGSFRCVDDTVVTIVSYVDACCCHFRCSTSDWHKKKVSSWCNGD